MFVNQIALALFFLYFVLMSGSCSEIMNCGLQRYIKDKWWPKHVMLFLSIYIFTYILNWYTVDSLIVENFEHVTEKKQKTSSEKKLENISYLKKSLYYSLIIYLIFIISTKSEGMYLFTFLLLAILVVFGTIVNKSLNSEVFENIKGTFMISDEDKRDILQQFPEDQHDVNTIIKTQNIISTSFLVGVGILLIGNYKYYQRQLRDHGSDWSWIVFWFGYNKQCSSVNLSE